MAEADTAMIEEILGEVYFMNADKIKQTSKNKKLTAVLISVAEESGLASKEGRASFTKANGALLYKLGAEYAKGVFPHRGNVTQYIVDDKLTTGARIDNALKYISGLSQDAPWDAAEFEKRAGVGVVIVEADVEAVVKEVFEAEKETLMADRYRAVPPLRRKVAGHPAMVFAPGKMIKDVFDAQVLAYLGEKTAADNAPAKGKGKGKGKGKAAPKEKKDEGVYETLPDSVEYPPPEANKQLKQELLDKNLAFLKEIGATVITRFPPEPNGYLHIGHAKSMNLNFGYAKRKGGVCYLRFDDTNPASEKQEYIDSIQASLKWLGHNPYKITYSSDYFPQLFDFGVSLVKSDYGYVCGCQKVEIKKNRDARQECACRSRSVEENLRLFMEMKEGKHAPGSMTMRMKANMKSPDTAMRDMIAYRIIFDPPHPRTGSTWKIYPSYDFTHCICDSLENVTHSLCTTEFCTRRPAYEWVCHKLDIYVPPQREFGRMGINGTVLSKRKLLLLVNKGIVSGWDDPRLLTLDGLKRRGYTPEAINHFCKSLSVTRNEGATADLSDLERHCIKVMDRDARRLMVVLRPLKVVINNFGESKEVTVPTHPKRPEMGKHTIFTSKVCYIERDDFREEDLAGYRRLSPSNIVRLRHGPTIKLVEVKKEGDNIVELIVESVDEPKPSGTIHWVGEDKKMETEVRLYGRLFKSKNPSMFKGEALLDDIAEDSLEVIPNALIDGTSLGKCAPGDGAQFERVGYFTVDYDTKEGGKVIWNRTVPLKEDKTKSC